MAITSSENHMRTVRMTNPEWTPWSIGLCTSTWEACGAELEEVVLRHPRTWPNYQKGSVDFAHLDYGRAEDPEAGDITDAWGCVWRTGAKGVIGTVVEHPLADLSRLDDYVPPDYRQSNHMGPFDWEAHKRFMDREVAEGRYSGGSLDHGFHLLRLEYLLGYEQLMCCLVDDTPEFRRVVDMVHAFNMAFLTHMLELGAQTIGLPEDLGTQKGSMIGPRLFRKWGLPYHKALHDLAHRYGAITGFHCDGNIMDIADQILEINPDIFNPQDCLNGVENLAEAFKGRVCIALDYDRQYTLPYGTPREVADLVEYEVKTLGSSRGGLILQAEVRGPIPPENIDALATAMETYSTYWFNA
jgi:hypothetical protein